MNTNDRLLRVSLYTNAAYTGLWALVLLADAGTLAAPFGLSDPLPLRAVGVVFAGFSALLAAAGVRGKPREAAVVTVMDVGYVLASFALAGLGSGLLSATGRGVVAGVALSVAALVAAQTAGILRATRRGSSAPAMA